MNFLLWNKGTINCRSSVGIALFGSKTGKKLDHFVSVYKQILIYGYFDSCSLINSLILNYNNQILLQTHPTKKQNENPHPKCPLSKWSCQLREYLWDSYEYLFKT